MSASSAQRAADILEALAVPKGRVLYVQTSVDWLQKAGLTAAGTLADLLAWAAPSGTIVMPSYPFHTTHAEYLRTGPTFDVRRTPAAIGLLPESFRRTRGVVRSLDPDFAVAAIGPDAADIVGSAPAAPDPFGADSSYQRMLNRECTLVGMGVSLNTTSFIHLIDSKSEAGYPAPVYEHELFSTTVIDAAGVSHVVPRKAIRPPFQQRIKPSNVNREMQPTEAVFRSVEINGACFFKWDLGEWARWCLSHARQRAGAGQWPCWLADLETAAMTNA
jgi:aminoglycoside N3'-acetyltransferase